jgi:hypothetical protein
MGTLLPLCMAPQGWHSVQVSPESHPAAANQEINLCGAKPEHRAGGASHPG